MGGAEDGGSGGAEDGGMGGEGGSGEPPMSVCEQVCEGPPTDCMPNCIAGYCEVYYTNAMATAGCEALLDTMLLCFAAGADANWSCTQGNPSYDGQECQTAVDTAYGAGCI
jgi:hypothetical protein